MYQMMSEGLLPVFTRQPEHYAHLIGSKDYPKLRGMVFFYPFGQGTVVAADVSGLPENESGLFAMHIHEGGSCTGNETDPFADAGGHFHKGDQAHPMHAGDMPTLFSNGGRAWNAFYTERFSPQDIVGKTVILHGAPDDYRSQPAGNSGPRIACGVIY